MRHWGKPIQRNSCCTAPWPLFLLVVLGHECLHITCKMVYNHKHILHYGLLVCHYRNFHPNVVYVDEFHWFSTDDRLHQRELTLSLVLNTSPTVGYGFQQGLGHARPPESLFHEAQDAVTALVFHTMVAAINGSLPIRSQNDKDRCDILAIGRGCLQIQ